MPTAQTVVSADALALQRHQRVHRLVGIEEAGPGATRDLIGQGRGAAATIEGVVALPKG